MIPLVCRLHLHSLGSAKLHNKLKMVRRRNHIEKRVSDLRLPDSIDTSTKDPEKFEDTDCNNNTIMAERKRNEQLPNGNACIASRPSYIPSYVRTVDSNGSYVTHDTCKLVTRRASYADYSPRKYSIENTYTEFPSRRSAFRLKGKYRASSHCPEGE